MSMVGDAFQGFAAIGEGQSARSAAVLRKRELDNEAQLQSTAAAESQAYMSADLQRTLETSRRSLLCAASIRTRPRAWRSKAARKRLYGQNIQRTAFNARQQSASLIMAGRAAAMSGEAGRNSGIPQRLWLFLQGRDGSTDSWRQIGGWLRWARLMGDCRGL